MDTLNKKQMEILKLKNTKYEKKKLYWMGLRVAWALQKKDQWTLRQAVQII